MISKNQIINFVFKVLPITVVIAAIFLLIHEVHQFIHLPSKYDHLYESGVDFLKYKEDTYTQLFLWALLLFVGIMGLINDKLKWIGCQIFIIKLLVSSVLIIFVDYLFNEIRILFGIVFLGLILIEIQLYKQKIISKIKINKVNIISSVIFGLMSAAIYWAIRLNT